MDRKVVVIDNGTGYTKMGWAGNPEPTYDIPTVIADHVENKNSVQVSKTQHDQLDFFIGNEALDKFNTHTVTYPISSGIVRDWSLMEKFWHRSIFDYLRCEPDDTVFILTEPPMNPPENREQIAEIMFETFNVQGLNISVQATLALFSSYFNEQKADLRGLGLTGCVLDSGDGVTHVIPISDGAVVGSCIKHIPLAGRDITKFVSQCLQDRGEKFPTQDLARVSREIKEKYGYTCEDGNLLNEYKKYSAKKTADGKQQLSAKFKKHTWVSAVDKQTYTIDVGYERFLGPEMFFHPEFFDAKYRTSIDQIIDNAIQGSPIDYRRALYSNIVLSGGSTLFDNFPQRLQTEVQVKLKLTIQKPKKNNFMQKRVDTRLGNYSQKSGQQPQPIPVSVSANPFQRFAVWQGGSLLSTLPTFDQMYHTRKQYFEVGASIARQNPVTMQGM